MKIGDVVRVGGKRVALVIGTAHGYSVVGPAPDPEKMPSELHVRFLRDLHTRWVLAHHAEVLSEGR